MPATGTEGGGDVWLFAYGSLMWSPGFAPAEVRRARLHGYHRAFCIYSHVYCGTPERPGLVLGLDRGGACVGLALRIAGSQADEVLARVHRREMVTEVYTPKRVPVTLLDQGPGADQGTGADQGAGARRLIAHTYLARRDHAQYAGRLAPGRAAELIAQGVGAKGSSRAYLEKTVAHLARLDIRDPALERLQALVARLPGPG